jgi:glycosyltransferase involved in cell wall biosynthesis
MALNLEDLHLLHIDTGRAWRGGQAQVLTLCRGLREKGVRQTLVAPPHSPLAERAAAADIEVVPLKMRGDWDLFAPRRLRRVIAERGVRLVHAHDAHAHALARRATAPRNARSLKGTRRGPAPRSNVGLVVSRRVDFEISRGRCSCRKYLDPRVWYFAISNGVRDVLARGGVAADRVIVVHSGVDPGRFSFRVPREKVRAEFHIAADAPIIGTIGSLVDHKDHRCFIDAALVVLARYPAARFIIVGEGELRRALERRIAQDGLEKAVLLAGYRDDVETFLSGFDIYVLSSHLEGLCTSLIDAMLFRLPIAATRTGGVPDLIRDGETGLLAPPKDPLALARAIERLLSDSALARRLGEAARAHALDDFTAEALVRNTLAGYEKVLE